MTTVRQLIDAAPISRLQKRILLFCLLINMAEGYDILSMSLAVVPLAEQWSLSGSEIGFVLAIGPIGMAVGSFLLGPAADRFGRRTLLIGSLSLTAVFMLLSALATDATTLSIFRFIVGVGMGGILPCLTILVSEFAPARKRSSMIGFLAVGVPLGGLVGGAIAAVFIQSYGWQSVFVIGAVLTGSSVIAAVLGIPETPEFLESRNTDAARTRLAGLTGKLGLAIPTGSASDVAVDQAPTQAAGTSRSEPLRGGRLWSATMLALCASFFLAQAAYYFGNQWLPKLLVNAGMSTTQGISGVLMLSLGGVVGTLLFGVLTMRLSAFLVTAGFSIASAVLLVAFSFATSNLASSMVIAGLLGLFLAGAVTGLYTLVPMLFSLELRSGALGIGLGFGRVGAIVTPMLVGFLVDQGVQPETIFQLVAIPAAVCAVLILGLRRVSKAQEAAQMTPPSTPAEPAVH